MLFRSPPPTTRQDTYVPGLPLGTRGGIKFTHTFPADGEYRITLGDLGLGLYPRAVETRQTLVVLVDRVEQFRADIGGVTVADTRRPVLVWDGTPYPATYAFPEADVAAALVNPRAGEDREVLDLEIGDRVVEGAAWRTDTAPGLAAAVVLAWDAVDV